MATFTASIFSYGGTAPNTAAALNDLQGVSLGARKQGVIQPAGVLYPGRSAATGSFHQYIIRPTTFALQEATGYFTQTAHTVTFPNVGPYPESLTLGTWSTASGLMDGVVSDGTTVTDFDIEAKRTGVGLEEVTIDVQVYKVIAGPSNVLIGSAEVGFLTLVQTLYTAQLAINTKFDPGDLLRIIYIAKNYGAPI